MGACARPCALMASQHSYLLKKQVILQTILVMSSARYNRVHTSLFPLRDGAVQNYCRWRVATSAMRIANASSMDQRKVRVVRGRIIVPTRTHAMTPKLRSTHTSCCTCATPGMSLTHRLAKQVNRIDSDHPCDRHELIDRDAALQSLDAREIRVMFLQLQGQRTG